MTNVKIDDPWFESVYKSEFNANPVKFLEAFKTLLSEKHRRERKIVSLLKRYNEANISVGKIAENLNMDRDEVLALMKTHNIYLVDYDFTEDEKTLSKYLAS